MQIDACNLPAGSPDASPAKLLPPFGVIASAHIMTSADSKLVGQLATGRIAVYGRLSDD
jgi:hypothetical protein